MEINTEGYHLQPSDGEFGLVRSESLDAIAGAYKKQFPNDEAGNRVLASVLRSYYFENLSAKKALLMVLVFIEPRYPELVEKFTKKRKINLVRKNV